MNAFLANKPSSIAFNGDLSAKSPFTGLSGNAHLRQNYYILYAQDEWKITPTLTMSYGLRWEYYQPLHEVSNKDVCVRHGRRARSCRAKGRTGTTPRSTISGRAWRSPGRPKRFDGKTVFRIGSGYYYGPGQTEDQLQPEANDRIGKTITSGPLLAYPLDINQIYSSYDINDPEPRLPAARLRPGLSRSPSASCSTPPRCSSNCPATRC